jgi:flagellar hook-length control protein FliK
MTATPQMKVETPFGQPGWSREVDQKLTWIVTNARQQADLVLNPPQLGRIEVSIVMTGDQLTATFSSPHQAVREALEDSMSRLRETLADSGVTLGQTHVGAESRRNAQMMNTANEGRTIALAGDEERLATSGTINGGPTWRSTPGRGMVDIFA